MFAIINGARENGCGILKGGLKENFVETNQWCGTAHQGTSSSQSHKTHCIVFYFVEWQWEPISNPKQGCENPQIRSASMNPPLLPVPRHRLLSH